MKKSFFIFGIIAIFAVLPVTGKSVAQVGCRAKASCSVEDDTGDTPICEGETYVACDSWMKWDFYFYRTAQDSSDCTLKPAVVGTSWYRTYPSQNYELGNHHDYGIEYVGASSSHKLQIDRIYLNTGNFTDISLEVSYFADTPTK